MSDLDNLKEVLTSDADRTEYEAVNNNTVALEAESLDARLEQMGIDSTEDDKTEGQQLATKRIVKRPRGRAPNDPNARVAEVIDDSGRPKSVWVLPGDERYETACEQKDLGKSRVAKSSMAQQSPAGVMKAERKQKSSVVNILTRISNVKKQMAELEETMSELKQRLLDVL